MRASGAHRMTPSEGIDPSSARTSTLLPAPFGPIMASDVPRGTVKVRFFRTSVAPNLTERRSASRMSSLCGLPSARGITFNLGPSDCQLKFAVCVGVTADPFYGDAHRAGKDAIGAHPNRTQ